MCKYVDSFTAALDCTTLINPENGRVDQMGFNFGDTATYTCNENFVLDSPGSQTRTCMENDWSGEDPTCGKLASSQASGFAFCRA